MDTREDLRRKLLDLDNRGYKAYKDILGSYNFEEFILIVDYVQGDPFAAPSKFRVHIPPNVAGFPQELYKSSPVREIALRDYLTRKFDQAAREISSRRGTGKSGMIVITRMGQEVLERSAAHFIPVAPPPPKPASGNPALQRARPVPSSRAKGIEMRFFVGLPAAGRQIRGRQASSMICDDIPAIVDRTLKHQNIKEEECKQYLDTIEDAEWLRQQIVEQDLVAFVPNGAILPRRSGVDFRPLKSADVVTFQSPDSLQVEFECPNAGKITGMGIPKGITLIVGGGYHGKSTLLKAIELGVYNHVPDDGRELVVTNPAAVKIRAEDGRSVAGVNISPFINQLPQDRSTTHFSTDNASGSTSQAANIVEMLEALVVPGVSAEGEAEAAESETPKVTPVLLVDEDTAATNFMIRDRRMQALIAKSHEPITPFIDKVRQLYDDYGVSTVLVMGGSGDYFDVADTVIAMENFQPLDLTEKAKSIASEYATGRTAEGGEGFGELSARIPIPESLDTSSGRRDVRVKIRDADEVVFGSEDVDLSAVEQLVSRDQLRAIAAAMVYARQRYIDGKTDLPTILDRIMADIQAKGLDVVTQFPQGDLAMFRRFELAAAINRLRTLEIKQEGAEAEVAESEAEDSDVESSEVESSEVEGSEVETEVDATEAPVESSEAEPEAPVEPEAETSSKPKPVIKSPAKSSEAETSSKPKPVIKSPAKSSETEPEKAPAEPSEAKADQSADQSADQPEVQPEVQPEPPADPEGTALSTETAEVSVEPEAVSSEAEVKADQPEATFETPIESEGVDSPTESSEAPAEPEVTNSSTDSSETSETSTQPEAASPENPDTEAKTS